MATIIETTDKYVFDLFAEHLPNTFTYHNYEHTKRVWESTEEIVENSKVDANEAEILLLASLLHDTGYIKTREGHEEESVKISTEFLKSQNVDDAVIKAVNKCIMATKFDTQPVNKDADCSHFGKKYFTKVSELLRIELDLQDVNIYSAEEWRAENIKVLTEKHKYYSDYAKDKWGKRKKKNLVKLMDSENDYRIKGCKDKFKVK